MTALTTGAIVIGSIVMVAGGFAIAGALLWLAASATGKYAWRTWNNLAGIYKLYTMQYWFKRMQANGTHVLGKEHDDKLAQKQFNDARSKLVQEADRATAQGAAGQEGRA